MRTLKKPAESPQQAPGDRVECGLGSSSVLPDFLGVHVQSPGVCKSRKVQTFRFSECLPRYNTLSFSSTEVPLLRPLWKLRPTKHHCQSQLRNLIFKHSDSSVFPLTSHLGDASYYCFVFCFFTHCFVKGFSKLSSVSLRRKKKHVFLFLSSLKHCDFLIHTVEQHDLTLSYSL